jgi:phosphate acetyltransferase
LGGRLVLAEGWDPRIQEAARLLEAEEIAVVRTLPRSVRDDPQTERVAELLASRKPDKVRDAEHARTLASDPLRFAAGLVALGEADAAVAGATCPTAEVLRAALWGIGPAEGIQTVSSSFYMAFDDSPLTERASPGEPGAAGGAPGLVLTFTDSAVVPDPDAVQLADIALAAAGDRRLIVGDEPIVAFLSYSSKGSAEGLSVEKVRQAVVRFRELAASIPCDGELQGDAALVPSIGERKRMCLCSLTLTAAILRTNWCNAWPARGQPAPSFRVLRSPWRISPGAPRSRTSWMLRPRPCCRLLAVSRDPARRMYELQHAEG